MFSKYLVGYNLTIHYKIPAPENLRTNTLNFFQLYYNIPRLYLISLVRPFKTATPQSNYSTLFKYTKPKTLIKLGRINFFQFFFFKKINKKTNLFFRSFEGYSGEALTMFFFNSLSFFSANLQLHQTTSIYVNNILIKNNWVNLNKFDVVQFSTTFNNLFRLVVFDSTKQLNFMLIKHLIFPKFLPKLSFKRFLKKDTPTYLPTTITCDYRSNTYILLSPTPYLNAYPKFINWRNFRYYNWSYRI